jgi:hypothetical protein
MNLVLKDLTDKEKREDIVTQINYYKKVLQAKGDKKLFVQSKVVKGKRVKLQTEDLLHNLKEISSINKATSESNEKDQNDERRLKPEAERIVLFAEQKKKLLEKLKLQRTNCQ